MKAITTTLYVCGGLMIAAAVLGAVDYSSACRKGTMDKLYKEEKPEVKAPPAPKEIGVEDYSRGEINHTDVAAEANVPEPKAAKKITAKIAKKKKKITLKEFSRKAIEPLEEIALPDSLQAKK